MAMNPVSMSNTTPEFTCPFDLKTIKESLAVAERLATAAMMTPPAARRRLAARKLEMGGVDPMFKPPHDVLMYLVRMGSFSSTPKIENPDSADDDIIGNFKQMSREELLTKCCTQIDVADRPSLLQRPMRCIKTIADGQKPLRVLQWNVLSQSLGVSNDNFTRCPPAALDWTYRRFQLIQEIIQYDPDIICLQEVDHFALLEAALGSIGYEGKFMPKPDSPCVYLAGNNGPDGCALFYRTNRLEILSSQTRILEVWRLQSNQVGLACVLKDKETDIELCAATTHLKARAGALLATLRDNQGKDLLDWLARVAAGRPTILSGDFNAEPNEPVYRTVTNHRLNLRSAYCESDGEPPYTTWKVREEGEISHTIDYIFHSSTFHTCGLLDFPTDEQLGPDRAPGFVYPSDHFSLVADLVC